MDKLKTSFENVWDCLHRLWLWLKERDRKEACATVFSQFRNLKQCVARKSWCSSNSGGSLASFATNNLDVATVGLPVHHFHRNQIPMLWWLALQKSHLLHELCDGQIASLAPYRLLTNFPTASQCSGFLHSDGISRQFSGQKSRDCLAFLLSSLTLMSRTPTDRQRRSHLFWLYLPFQVGVLFHWCHHTNFCQSLASSSISSGRGIFSSDTGFSGPMPESTLSLSSRIGFSRAISMLWISLVFLASSSCLPSACLFLSLSVLAFAVGDPAGSCCSSCSLSLSLFPYGFLLHCALVRCLHGMATPSQPFASWADRCVVLESFAVRGSQWWDIEGRLVSEASFFCLLSWLFACLLLVELDSLLDLEFCLSWTRVYFKVDDIEITVKNRCMDLGVVWSSVVVQRKRKREEEKKKRDRRRRHVTQEGVWKIVRSLFVVCTGCGSPCACFLGRFSFLMTWVGADCGLWSFVGDLLWPTWQDHLLEALMWLDVARRSLENLVVALRVHGDFLR